MLYTTRRLRLPRLAIDVAIIPVGCAERGCLRVVPPGDVVVMRQLDAQLCAEPLCAVCAAAAVEDARLRVRLELHAREQRLAAQDDVETDPEIDLAREPDDDGGGDAAE